MKESKFGGYIFMIGERIRYLRIKKGYSITRLAKEAGVSKSYLSNLDRGVQNNPSLQFLEKIVSTLDTSVDYLIGDHIEEEIASREHND